MTLAYAILLMQTSLDQPQNLVGAHFSPVYTAKVNTSALKPPATVFESIEHDAPHDKAFS